MTQRTPTIARHYRGRITPNPNPWIATPFVGNDVRAGLWIVRDAL
jgi:hypothetical protein